MVDQFEFFDEGEEELAHLVDRVGASAVELRDGVPNGVGRGLERFGGGGPGGVGVVDGGEVEEYNIGTYVYCARPALDLNKFDYAVGRLWPRNIIRAKGLCYFTSDIDKCYLFEQAGVQKSLREAGLWYAAMPKDQLNRLLETDEALRRDWDPAYGDRMQKIVFIGQNLDKAAIKEIMDSCLAE